MTEYTTSPRFATVASVALAAVLAVGIAGLALAGGAVAQEADGNFRVDINSTNSPVTENDTLEVEVIVENIGQRTASQEVNLTIDGNQVDSKTVALDSGARTSVTLEWETTEGDEGDHLARVSSRDDTDAQSVTVQNVPNFDVEIDATNEPVTEGEELVVEATVENTDRATDTQDIELIVDGLVRDTESVTLDNGDSTTVSLSWATESGDGGEYEANVSSETDNDSVNVLINVPPSTAFTREPTQPNVNEAVTLDGTESTDPDGAIAEFTWEIDGETVSSAGAFSYTFTEPGDHEVVLTVTDDDGATSTETRTVTVNEQPTVSIVAGDTATVGEEVSIEADASDDGTISRYEWRIDGEVVATGPTLCYAFTEAGAHQVTVEVTDDDGATTATTTSITVESDAAPTPTETPTPTDSTQDEDQPGFDVGLGLIAVLATAFLARRRT